MTASTYRLRPARLDELPRLSEIEDEAGEMYAEAEIPADLPGLSLEVLADAQREGMLWVAADTADAPAAFALCWRRPNAIHLRELDVAPAHMHQRLGRRLIEEVRNLASHEGRALVTLTTFAEVPWNAPLYHRYGFVEVPTESQPPWLAEIRVQEAREGLDRWPRLAMARSAETDAPAQTL